MARTSKNRKRSPKAISGTAGPPPSAMSADYPPFGLGRLDDILGDEALGTPGGTETWLDRSLRPSRGRRTGSEPETPLDRANAMVWGALQQSSEKRRVALVRKALTISPDCAEAWMLLADELASTPAQGREFYQEAVAAAERALGPEALLTDGDAFMAHPEAETYMDARLGLAEVLRDLDDLDGAIEQYLAMLRHDPDDDEFVRYPLLSALIAEDRHDEVGGLLARFPDEGSIIWMYAIALCRFGLDGDGPVANTALSTAIRSNPYAPAYLLGMKPLNVDPSLLFDAGNEDEARNYILEGLPGWLRTPGAIEWMRARTA